MQDTTPSEPKILTPVLQDTLEDPVGADVGDLMKYSQCQHRTTERARDSTVTLAPDLLAVVRAGALDVVAVSAVAAVASVATVLESFDKSSTNPSTRMAGPAEDPIDVDGICLVTKDVEVDVMKGELLAVCRRVPRGLRGRSSRM